MGDFFVCGFGHGAWSRLYRGLLWRDFRYDDVTDLWIVAKVVNVTKEIKKELETFKDSDIEIVEAEIVTEEETD